MFGILTNHTSAGPLSNRKNARFLGKPACSAMGGQAGLVMKGTAYYHLLRLLYLLRKVLTSFLKLLTFLCGISGYFQAVAAKLWRSCGNGLEKVGKLRGEKRREALKTLGKLGFLMTVRLLPCKCVILWSIVCNICCGRLWQVSCCFQPLLWNIKTFSLDYWLFLRKRISYCISQFL